MLSMRPLLLLISVALFSVSASVARADGPIRVTLLGDSITNGVVTGGGTRWGELLADSLATTHIVDNVGCGGTTSVDWTLSQGGFLCGNRLIPEVVFQHQAVPSLPSDFVTVMLGTNDALGFFEPAPVLPLAYLANLEEIVANSLAEGARTIVLMSPPPQCGPSQASFLLDGYRYHGIDLCTQHPDVLCGVDVYTLLGPGDFVGCDVHPTQSGHTKIFAALEDVLLAHWPREPRMQVYQWETIPELGNSAVLPVVLSSSAGFSAPADVDLLTLSFGETGFEPSLVWVDGAPACLPLDVDGDGSADLVCAFSAAKSGLHLGSSGAELRARTLSGSAVDASALGSAASLDPFPRSLLEQLEQAL
jgi:lysophospholipase L1-like esterase